MKFYIRCQTKEYLRVHMAQAAMTCREADILQYYLQTQPNVVHVKVYERTADATIQFVGDRADIICALKKFCYDRAEAPEVFLDNSGRDLNRAYKEKIVNKTLMRAASCLFLPYPIRAFCIGVKSLKYIWEGVRTLLKGRLEVEVLDATAIGVSVLRGNLKTASSIMFLLGIGELLEQWTHKKSVGDLARSMSLQVEKVWLKREGQEILVSVADVAMGDEVVVHMGNVIPFDGLVSCGEAMVNQSSFTGESLPVRKDAGSLVYAGTVLEEGELIVQVKEIGSSTRYEKIVAMIEESEKLKSALESKAERLADRLVPYAFLGTGLTWLLTRNATKAITVLMVDFSCALKLAMPIAVLSAIREASLNHITVKGGKYLEAVAEASTVVFDKTGTLTKALPTLKNVVSFCEESPAELLRIAACLEEHFPHSMANAVVRGAMERGLEHEEMHSKVEYIVAHGISSYIGEKKVVIGSYHFVFEDEDCTVDPAYQDAFDGLPTEYSHLYMAMDRKLIAALCIEDPLREEAEAVVNSLRRIGIGKIVMMTGDSERTAASVAEKIQVDEYYSEVLPEDKARFIEEEKKSGQKVIMIGDGINDSPALSAADVGIAISDGAEIAREIADITISSDDLYEVVTLRLLSVSLMKRIRKNYRAIVGINTALILLGVAGFVQPATAALFHNTSTLAIALKSMGNLL
ncbi:MAG: heavy metal translocating P-type ATPase [Lachnospiraceae bacterium]|nr:heavy metal translocating P-type ATPase [Lachnospiraceae bacterium]